MMTSEKDLSKLTGEHSPTTLSFRVRVLGQHGALHYGSVYVLDNKHGIHMQTVLETPEDVCDVESSGTDYV